MVGVFVSIAVVLVALGGLLAAADAALGVLSRADVAALAETSRAKRSLAAIAADPASHTVTASFVRVVAETTAAVLVTLALASVFEEWWWTLLLAALSMTLISFVLVGASPRSVGRRSARTVVRWSAWPVHAFRVLLGPLAGALMSLGEKVTPGAAGSVGFSSEEQLLSMVDEATELEVLEEDDRELIHSIFEFNETVVREIMVPRTDMITIEADARLDEAMELFLASGVSRIPVIGEDVDEVLGVLYLRDLARLSYERRESLADEAVRSVMRPAIFVPESKNADEMLEQMQRESNHIALVVDEYGGIAGLVTLEDLIEELVGEISDEYDQAAAEVQELPGERFRVSARLPVDELGELFGLDLDDDEVDSVGGLLAKALGRLPQAGSTALVHGLRLTADRIQGRGKQLVTVLVERVEPALFGDEEVEDG